MYVNGGMRVVKKGQSWRRSACVSLVVALVLGLAAPAMAGMTPSSVVATLAPGASITELKTVDVPGRPMRADVVFAFDLTGSMSGVLNTAKANATAMMDTLNAMGVDVQFGVMSHMDYPGYYDSFGYATTYGDASFGDYAYRLDRAVTADTPSVNAAIGTLSIGNGVDNPEDYTRILYESYADPNVGWRPGAKRILVKFGDNVPHDDNLEEGISGGSWSTGGDPGRDGVMGTADDLDLQSVLAQMAANNVSLIACQTWGYYKVPYWDYWSGLTGGACYATDSATVVDDVVGAVTAALTVPTVANLHLEASAGYESWLESVVPASYSGPTGVSVQFSPTIRVPLGTAPGVYSFTISAVDDGGVSYGDQTVEITVPSVAKPILTMTKTATRWSDFAARELEVTFSVKNTGPGAALNTKTIKITATAPVIVKTLPPIVVGTGTIAPGGSGSFKVKYTIPVGVSNFKTTLGLQCEDSGGNVLMF
jgi:hypothetical protein